jgi:DNA-binding cell septation regulator SpoVG
MNLSEQPIEILALHPMPQNGSRIKGFIDIRLGDLIIREFRVLAEWNGSFKVVPPRISWKGTDGNMRFKTVISFPRDVKDRINALILSRFTAEEKDAERQHG